MFCCVDRPWPRAVLNALAYRDLVPVLDGGIAIDAFADGDSMRGATWRSHVIRPGRSCMICIGQLDLGMVAADRAGTLDDPAYIAGVRNRDADHGQNVAVLSISAVAGLLTQYASFNVAPGGLGDPGPIQYVLTMHTLEHVDRDSRSDCVVEALTADGDGGLRLTGDHPAAEAARTARRSSSLPAPVRLARFLHDIGWRFRAAARQWSRRRLTAGTGGTGR